MKLDKFNADDNGFRFEEVPPYNGKRRFILQQYCPIAKTWCNCLLPGMSRIFHLYMGIKPEVYPDLVKQINKEKQTKRVLIAKEKHFTRYFDASTTEDIGLACLELLRERYENRWYNPYEHDIEKPTQKPEDFPEDYELTKFLEDRWKMYNEAKEDYKERKEIYDLIEECLKEHDYIKAYQVMYYRQDYEYESFEIVELENPK